MKYDHIVNVNGVYYPAGAEVPAASTKKVENDVYTDENIVMETEPVRRGRPKKN